VKFHANLKRRDKLPFIASMIGVGAAGLGTWPMAAALRLCGNDGPTLQTLALVLAAALCAWVVYVVSLPPAMKRLVERREFILRAVTRE
jgi:ABC-2 type transport system permease protein